MIHIVIAGFSPFCDFECDWSCGLEAVVHLAQAVLEHHGFNRKHFHPLLLLQEKLIKLPPVYDPVPCSVREWFGGLVV